MEEQLNLYLALHPTAHRNDENFTTAAFVHLLRHLAKQHPRALLAILDLFGSPDLRFTAEDIPQLELRTWAAVPPHGIPDIHIHTPSKLLLIEVKVAGNITPKQVVDYLAALRKSRKDTSRRLALLTRNPLSFDLGELLEKEGKGEKAGAVRWYEVADVLDANRPPGDLQPATFLTEQFLEFAYGQSLMVAQLRSDISRGLRKYRSGHHQDSVFSKRVRHLSRLANDEDLKGLHDLLLMIDEALRRSGAAPSAKLDSGQHEGGWIGYNIQDMHYFVYVRLQHPEVVVFQDYRGPVVKAAVPQGRGYVKTAARRTTWQNELDLAGVKPAFFEASKPDQLRQLQDFYLTSKAWADEIEAASMQAMPSP